MNTTTRGLPISPARLHGLIEQALVGAVPDGSRDLGGDRLTPCMIVRPFPAFRVGKVWV